MGEQNELYENKIINLNIELIIKEQTYNNLIKKRSDNEKEFYNIKKEFDNLYNIWNLKNQKIEEKNNILLKINEQHKEIKNNKIESLITIIK